MAIEIVSPQGYSMFGLRREPVDKINSSAVFTQEILNHDH